MYESLGGGPERVQGVKGAACNGDRQQEHEERVALLDSQRCVTVRGQL